MEEEHQVDPADGAETAEAEPLPRYMRTAIDDALRVIDRYEENIAAIQRAQDLVLTAEQTYRPAIEAIKASPLSEMTAVMDETAARIAGIGTLPAFTNPPFLGLGSPKILEIFSTSPISEAVASAGQAATRVAGLGTFPAFKPLSFPGLGSPKILQISKVAALAQPDLSRVTQLMAGRPLLSTDFTSRFAGLGAAVVDAKRLWPTGAFDMISRTHRDLALNLAEMSSTWHKGLLPHQLPAIQLPGLPQLPDLSIGLSILNKFDWTPFQTGLQTATELHRLLHSWKILSTDFGSVLGRLARAGFIFALKARDSVIRGDGDTSVVAEFVANWLHLKPTPERIHAVAAALLEEGWDDQPMTALDTIKVLVRKQRRAQRPVWETQLHGGLISLLEQPLAHGGTLGDHVTDHRSAEDHALVEAMPRPIDVVMRKFKPAELEVLLAYAAEDRTWAEAAAQAGHPHHFGERVRRKAKYLGNQYKQRHGDIEL